MMTNHLHMIVRAKQENLSDIIRDFKKFTSKRLYRLIQDNPQESRKAWINKLLSIDNRIWFWEEGYHGEEVYSLDFFTQKADYIHLNPVRAGFVKNEEDYSWSSACDFQRIKTGKLELAKFG